MNKRSAIAIAGGVTGALISGVASSPSLHQTGGSSVASGEQEIEHDDDAGGGYEDD
jgi:hypothetical protein